MQFLMGILEYHKVPQEHERADQEREARQNFEDEEHTTLAQDGVQIGKLDEDTLQAYNDDLYTKVVIGQRRPGRRTENWCSQLEP